DRDLVGGREPDDLRRVARPRVLGAGPVARLASDRVLGPRLAGPAPARDVARGALGLERARLPIVVVVAAALAVADPPAARQREPPTRAPGGCVAGLEEPQLVLAAEHAVRAEVGAREDPGQALPIVVVRGADRARVPRGRPLRSLRRVALRARRR